MERRAANYQRPKILVTKNVHILYQRYFLACVPLDFAIHMLGILDILLALVTMVVGLGAKNKSEQEALEEVVSPNGIKYSYVYEAIMYGFLIMSAACFIPRSLLYLFYLLRGLRIKPLHWYLEVKSATYFLLCLLALSALVISFIFSTLLTSTFGTSVAYMLALIMIPVVLTLSLDLYLCITARKCLDERIWKAQPKINHKRKGYGNDEEDQTKTEFIETKNSKNAY